MDFGIEITPAMWGIAAIITVFLILFLIFHTQQFIYFFRTGVCRSTKMMTGKTVILTGCTSGIGRETARDLAKRGARLIMACRNTVAAGTFQDELIEETGNNEIIVKKLDLSSFKSVREFAEQINCEENQLNVLIHNAGTAESFKKKISADGLEMTMATNQYGPFLLTHLLIGLLKRSAPSRIIVTTSCTYRLASLNLNNLNPTTNVPVYAYCLSKNANILFTLELSRRLNGTGVTANCLHPGLVETEIWRNVYFPLSWGLWFLRLFFKTAKQGAQTTIYLAVSEDVENVTGKFFSECREYGVTKGVKDPTKAKKFWELSKNIVQLQPSDPQI